MFDDKRLFENIILPTVNNTQDITAEKFYTEGFCPVLCNMFETTKSVSFNTYNLSKDHKSIFVYGNSSDMNSYSNTQMSILEEYIENLETHKIVPNKFLKYRPDILNKY